MNCPLISSTALIDATTFSITLEDTVTIRFDCGTSNSYHAIKQIYNGSETTIGDIRTWEEKVFTVVYSSNFIYIKKVATNTGRFGFLYEKYGDQKIFGSSNGNDWLFETLPLLGSSDGLTYYISKMLNYSQSVGSIDYTVGSLFQSNLKIAEDNNYLSCTNVTADEVLTFESENYYSLGPNTLAKLDE